MATQQDSQEKQFKKEFNSFLCFAFNNVLKNGHVGPMLHLSSENYPGGFAHDKSFYDMEKSHIFNIEGHGTIFVSQEDGKLQVGVKPVIGNPHVFQLVPTKPINNSWLNVMFKLVTYIYHQDFTNAKAHLITYTAAGYKVIPIPGSKLFEEAK